MHYCDLNFHPRFHVLFVLQVGSLYFFALHHNGKMAMYKLRHSFASNSNATPPSLIQRNLMYKKLIEAMLGAYIGNMYIKLTDHFKILQLLGRCNGTKNVCQNIQILYII